MGGEAAGEVTAVHEANGPDPVDDFGGEVLGVEGDFVEGVLGAVDDIDVGLALASDNSVRDNPFFWTHKAVLSSDFERST